MPATISKNIILREAANIGFIGHFRGSTDMARKVPTAAKGHKDADTCRHDSAILALLS